MPAMVVRVFIALVGAAVITAGMLLGMDRVMYAMDYPYQFVPSEVEVTDGLPLSADRRAMLYQHNAEKVFRLV